LSYLLDTNVVSELAKPRPTSAVLGWFRDTPDELLHLSVLSAGELRNGVERLPDGTRKERLRVWLEADVPEWFGARLLAVTAGVAERWGRLLAEVRRPVPAIDSLLAATALHHGLRIVTRNEADFRFPGVVVINPWVA
jgi:predicted nucleic acid-binding protein